MNNLAKKSLAIVFTILLLAQGTNAKKCESKECDCGGNNDNLKKVAAAAVGGAGLLYAVPMVLGTIGFGPFGIAASSLASYMMSSAATAGVGGAVVGVLQSVGAAGLGTAGSVLVGSVGAAGGAASVGSDCDCQC